jgi:hypothetical protein
MVVLWDYLLSSVGRSLLDTPAALEKAKEMSLPAESALTKAPLVVRESLLFPYRDGMQFAFSVLQAQGRERAFANMLEQPPSDSHEILAPLSYLAKEAQPDPVMPDLSSALGKKYPKFDTGAVGEFDLRLLLMQFNVPNAEGIASGWKGGMYYAGQRGNATPRGPDDVALLYVSYWKDEAAAAAFRSAYEPLIPQRYPGLQNRGGVWRGSAGPIKIVQLGNTIIASEGYDENTADALIALLTHPTGKQIAPDHGELLFGLNAHAAALMRSAGIH